MPGTAYETLRNLKLNDQVRIQGIQYAYVGKLGCDYAFRHVDGLQLTVFTDGECVELGIAAVESTPQRRELSIEERNAIYAATGGGEAYGLAIEWAELS